MTEHDTILAVLQSDIGIAALIVVFTGFLLTNSETFETKRCDKYRIIPSFSLAPLLACVVSLWISMNAIEGVINPRRERQGSYATLVRCPLRIPLLLHAHDQFTNYIHGFQLFGNEGLISTVI